MDYPKSVVGLGLVDGRFVDEDPIAGTLGSVIPASWGNALTDEILNVIKKFEEPNEADNKQLLRAIMELSRINGRKECLFKDLPTANDGTYFVIDRGYQPYSWVESAFFKGYRSELTGKKWNDQQIIPRPWTIDAIGGPFNKKTYAGLWGWAQENGLVVPNASWNKNLGFKFADIDANNFRVPDLRDTFDRAYGTDADTAKARASGTSQIDAIQKIVGSLHVISGGNFGVGAFVASEDKINHITTNWVADVGRGIKFDSSLVARSSNETRPNNVAYYPRLNV